MNENNVLQTETVQNETYMVTQEQIYTPAPPFELEKRDIIFTVCALVASVFTCLFGIFNGFNLGYFISSLLLLVSFTVYLIKKKSLSLFSGLCIILSLANSVVFITTTNASVKLFGMIVGFLLAILGISGIASGKAKGNRETLGVFYSMTTTFGNVGVSLRSIFSNSGDNKKSIGKALLGVACAIPALIIIVPLLATDEAFRGMMNSIFNNLENGFIIILKVVVGVSLSILVVTYGYSMKFGRFSKPKESTFNGIDNVYIISFMSVIAVCYLLYLFSQLAYFFSAFSGFLPDDTTTHSEYARSGFFEMCIIALINFALVLLSLLLSKKQKGNVCVGIKVVATFIALFTLIIIATSISKMVLYMSEYGMTVLRITTSAFMVFLAITFIAVVLRIFMQNINIVKTSLVTAGVIVLLLGIVNVNSFCARYNYDAYKAKSVQNIDVEAMYNLGDEGIPYLTKLACSKDSEVALEAQRYLAIVYTEDYFVDMYNLDEFDAKTLEKHQKYTGFSYFNIPRNRAYKALYKFIENNPQFDEYCLQYNSYYSDIDFEDDLW